MSTAPPQWLSPQEYLARERRAEIRSEYLRGEAFAKAGASYEHTLIKDNLAREAGNQLKNGPCRVLTYVAQFQKSFRDFPAFPAGDLRKTRGFA